MYESPMGTISCKEKDNFNNFITWQKVKVEVNILIKYLVKYIEIKL